MAKDSITLKMEGLVENEKHVLLPVFVDKLDSLKKILNQIDTKLFGKKKNDFRVVDLSHSSPARVVVQAVSDEEGIDSSATVNTTVDYINQITNGDIPDNVDYSLLTHFKELGRGIGTGFNDLSLKSDNTIAYIGKKFLAEVELALSEEDFCEGSVDGFLEAINLHDGKNTFNIYPIVGASKVQCHFPPELHDDAINGVDKKVLVSGLLKYRRGESFPSSVEVRTIDVYPPEEELPTFESLYGFAPKATGSLSSEDFIRKLRDEWDD